VNPEDAFTPIRSPVVGAGADSWRQTSEYVESGLRANKIQNIVDERRMVLRNLQTERQTIMRGEAPFVGNNIVYISNAENGHVWLIIYGCVSAEVAGTWYGGRSNSRNSIVFQVKPEAVEKFLNRIDTTARGYDEGTTKNFEALRSAMSGVFAESALKLVDDYMFHRQEFHTIVDSRKK
jgi:hypothetical protein